jgi:hypothetical protein
MGKGLFLVTQSLVIALGVTTAAAQNPSKEAMTRYLDNVETLAFCYAHHAGNGNIFKSSGQKAKAIAAYNTAFPFQFFVLSTIIGGVQKKWFSVDQFRDLLKNVEAQYPSLTSKDKEQFKELCPNAHKVFFASLNERLQNTVITSAKEQSEIYYKTRPTSVDDIIEDAKQALAKEKR